MNGRSRYGLGHNGESPGDGTTPHFVASLCGRRRRAAQKTLGDGEIVKVLLILRNTDTLCT
jgi:hypothetical protein